MSRKQRAILFFLTAIIIPLILASYALAASKPIKHNEHYYQEQWCKGITEFRLANRSRVDCETETHSIEFDFAPKYQEAIGQSLFYAMNTNKRAGIVLILRKKKDYRYWIRLNSVIARFKLPITTWIIQDY